MSCPRKRDVCLPTALRRCCRLTAWLSSPLVSYIMLIFGCTELTVQFRLTSSPSRSTRKFPLAYVWSQLIEYRGGATAAKGYTLELTNSLNLTGSSYQRSPTFRYTQLTAQTCMPPPIPSRSRRPTRLILRREPTRLPILHRLLPPITPLPSRCPPRPRPPALPTVPNDMFDSSLGVRSSSAWPLSDG